MAAGAHLTSTVNPLNKPSIFEVIAEEGLMHSLQPALKHASQVLAQRNPSRYGWLYAYGDEIFAAFQCILENHYLKNYGASFAENFYGLKRVPLADLESNHLPLTNRLRSLFCLVFIPYLKRKCDDLYESLKERPHSEGLLGMLCRAFLGVYPILHSTYEASMFGFLLAYVLGRNRVHSPLLRLAGVALCHLSLEDMNAMAPSVGKPLRDLRLSQSLWVLGKRALSATALALSSTLSMSIFFLQFLEWWYASDHGAKSLTALPAPPPPTMNKQPKGLPKLTAICPLCHKIRCNDTVLAVSGYVFCYPCILQYVRTHHRCPVTFYPANLDHLVKLFMPNT
ncbi:hypothetical protein CAPTEDRAFT_149232 [Capitella teleta]|uniref:Peroxisome assembly protein 12 n=1 Tax=Capitella teleta TaxID=283909 RepID=R7UDQ9_CAPTE|nr:hypothetical protein CAPTEDRAFT_149232 [Capitella teleta]|eukprot:ELU04124.1 hypothetical protein CAPTEDRAFT_149232 [Capitella teleta]